LIFLAQVVEPRRERFGFSMEIPCHCGDGVK
jgi:hypothetical protein